MITGTLTRPRRYFEEAIAAAGGKVADGVTARLSYLICGDSPGSKLDKANELGVKIVDEVEFKKML